MKKLLLSVSFIVLSAIFITVPSKIEAQLARPAQAGIFTIFGTAYTGDGLAPGWTNGSLNNGVNTWNIGDTQQFYAGIHSLSWAPSAPFERGWVVGTTPLTLSQYQFLNFYARSTEIGQRIEVGMTDQKGGMVGAAIPFESAGPPMQPDRWGVYSVPITQFNTGTTPVYGIFLRDMNGAPQKKVFLDEIELSTTKASTPIVSPGLGQPGTPTPPQKPKGPYYPQISPWVFIIPGLIIMIAIFFE
jgi:hypothetical protein